uniref:Uncharacterized protein n=1 Tax=Timema bartmani TaxID=61472 RepID=A0A7R9I830_9NEOP|nr:unnamed protein product [Timema bartmani]
MRRYMNKEVTVLVYKTEINGRRHEIYELHGARTILPLMMSGSGVTPEYQFTPDFLLYRFEGRTGRTVDLTLEIKNTCSAPLPFQIREVFTRAALDKPPTPPPTPEPQAKGKPIEREETPKDVVSVVTRGRENLRETFQRRKEGGRPYFQRRDGDARLVERGGVGSTSGGKMSGETEELPQRDDKRTKQVYIEGRGEARGKKQTTERGHLDPDVNKSRKKRKQSLLTGKKGAAQYQAAEIVYPLKYAVKYKVSLGNIIDVRELIFIASAQPLGENPSLSRPPDPPAAVISMMARSKLIIYTHPSQTLPYTKREE